MVSIKKLISPESVVVIGASSSPNKVGYQLLNNLISGKFPGKIIPVNPKGGEILGLQVSPSLSDISEPIDLAVIVLPKDLVLKSVKECAAKEIKNIIVISSGFSETGAEGKALEDEVVSTCRESDIALIGPNCLGVINTGANLNATFALGGPVHGPVSLISQSGAIISSMISMSGDEGVGFSQIFSLGNKAVIGETELLQHLYTDPETRVIIGYIESLKTSPELSKLLQENTKTKPTVLLFGGTSASGAAAAKSHTGSVVSSAIAAHTYLRQNGVIVAESLADLLLKAKTFSSYQNISGKNVAIITNAGGPAIVTVDAIESNDLKLAKFSDKTTTSLSSVLRPEASANNPVDLLGDASATDYQQALEIVAKDENVDAIIVLLTPQTSTSIEQTAEVIAKFESSKPILTSFIGGETLTSAKKIIEQSDKPCFSYPEEAVSAIHSLAEFAKPIKKVEALGIPAQDLDLEQKEAALDNFHLPIVKYSTMNSNEELGGLLNWVEYPAVAKTADSEAHKSDQGGVILNIKNVEELKSAAQKIGFPVVVGKMISTKFEILLGIKKDKNIGTTVLFGTGGIYSEIYHDFAYGIAPLSQESALQLILQTKIGQILDGARGQKKYDLVKLAEIIVNAVSFADTYTNVSEIDFNPIIATPNGTFEMVDVRVITSEN